MKITDPSFGKRFHINDRIIMKFMDFFLFPFLMLILLAKKGVFGGNKIITKSTHKRNKKHYQTINHSTTKTTQNIYKGNYALNIIFPSFNILFFFDYLHLCQILISGISNNFGCQKDVKSHRKFVFFVRHPNTHFNERKISLIYGRCGGKCNDL